jgi:hypothetical protein
MTGAAVPMHTPRRRPVGVIRACTSMCQPRAQRVCRASTVDAAWTAHMHTLCMSTGCTVSVATGQGTLGKCLGRAVCCWRVFLYM